MITITDLQKSYRDRVVLQIPELCVPAGSRWALIGPNGAGKSTFLRILAGVLEADKGTVSIPEPMRDGLGYMPQQPYAFGVSVTQNVLMALSGFSDGRKRAGEAIRLVGLEELAEARGSGLSGGETQRMALARMIARPRKLLLLDEPASATDISGGRRIEEAVTAYWKSTGCTLLFSTHSLAQAYRLADQVLLFSQGRIVESGPVEQVLKAPSSPEGRDFLQYWTPGEASSKRFP